MVANEIIPTLHHLSRADKWRVVRFLVSELSEIENEDRFDESKLAGRTFDVWSPEASIGAEAALIAALAAEKELVAGKNHG
ncbi:MAG: hypothetical protein ACRD82_17395 [Blastocatellia bacterium]